MDREKIIQMAREAGAYEKYYGINMTPGMAFLNHEDLERFTAAIRSATKEEDARICHVYGKRFHDESSANDGRQSDMAFGRVVAASEIQDAIRASK